MLHRLTSVPRTAARLSIVGLTLTATTTTSAAVVNIDALADTYIRESEPTTNRSTQVRLLVGHTASSADEFNGLLKFDLSDPQLVGATINAVTLTVTTDNDDSGSSTASTLQVYESLTNWDSTQTTWNNATNLTTWDTAGSEGAGNDYVNTLLASLTATPSQFGSNGGDSLALNSEAAFATAVADNIGGVLSLLLIVPDSQNRSVWFLESIESGNAPRLSIDFTPASNPIPEPGSLVLAGLGSVLLIARRRRSRD